MNESSKIEESINVLFHCNQIYFVVICIHRDDRMMMELITIEWMDRYKSNGSPNHSQHNYKHMPNGRHQVHFLLFISDTMFRKKI